MLIGSTHQPQPPAHALLDVRRHRRVRPDRAADLAVRDLRFRLGQPPLRAPDLRDPTGQLQPERRRLGVHPVRAADAQRVLELDRALLDDRAQVMEVFFEDRRRVSHLQRRRRVPHVLRRQPQVHPAPLVAEAVGDGLEERRHVVVRLRLVPRDVIDVVARRPHLLRIGDRHAPRLRPRIDNGDLDRQPPVELPALSPNRRHLRPRVSLNHLRSPFSDVTGSAARRPTRSDAALAPSRPREIKARCDSASIRARVDARLKTKGSKWVITRKHIERR